MPSSRFGWLVSYPKSGNTWLRVMLSSVLSRGAPIDINSTALKGDIATFAELDEFLCIEASELTRDEIAASRPALHASLAANLREDLILRKVHDRFWHTPSGEAVFVPALSRGAVYLIRDPRDVALSYAHHRGLDVDRLIDLMADASMILSDVTIRGREQLPQPLGSWSGHALSWLDQREIPVLMIRYEDMLADPLTYLGRAAAHLGLATTPAALAAAIEAASFDRLRTQEQTHGFRERQKEATSHFFREGRAGTWRDRLSPAQIDRIVTGHAAVMRRFGYL